MKKQYINPEVLVLNVMTTNLCGASDMHSDETLGASKALSREGNNNWEDE